MKHTSMMMTMLTLILADRKSRHGSIDVGIFRLAGMDARRLQWADACMGVVSRRVRITLREMTAQRLK